MILFGTRVFVDLMEIEIKTRFSWIMVGPDLITGFLKRRDRRKQTHEEGRQKSEDWRKLQ